MSNESIYRARRAVFCAALRENAHRQIVDQMYDGHGGCCAAGLFMEVVDGTHLRALPYLGIESAHFRSLQHANEKTISSPGTARGYEIVVRLTFPQIADWIEAQPYSF